MKDSFLEKKNNNNNNSAFRNYSGIQPPDLSTDHKTCLEGVLFVAIYFPANMTFHFPFNLIVIFFSFLLMEQLMILVINLCDCLFFSL